MFNLLLICLILPDQKLKGKKNRQIKNLFTKNISKRIKTS